MDDQRGLGDSEYMNDDPSPSWVTLRHGRPGGARGQGVDE
jgi:hypothetical protein